MKLNNHGWGMREMIIYTCILIILLLFVASSISSFYDSIESSQAKKNQEYQESLKRAEEEKKKKEQEEQLKQEETIINVDYNYYINLENKLKTATMNYMNQNAYDLSGQILNVTLDTLVNLNYVDKLYDQTGSNLCTGYSNVYEDINGSYVIKSYVSCSNYSTEGY